MGLSIFKFLAVVFVLNFWHKIIPPSQTPPCHDDLLSSLPERILLFLLRRTERWPNRYLRTLAKRRLYSVLKDAAKTPFWRDRFQAAGVRLSQSNLFEELLKIPPVAREEMRPLLLESISDHDGSPKLPVATTTGTTGVPLSVGMPPWIILHRRITRHRLFEFVGVTSRDRFITPRTKLNPTFCEREGFLSDNFNTLSDSGEILFSEMRNRRIEVLYSYPTLLSVFCDKISNPNIIPPLKCIITTGETLTENMRAKIERNFSAPLYNFYASVELGCIAQECLQRRGLHINSEFYYVETLDVKGQPAKRGKEGRVVITPLDAFPFPFVRYDTGDLGILIEDPCSCGRMLPRIIPRGRVSELMRIGGTVTSPYVLSELIQKVDPDFGKIKQHQFIQEGEHKLSLVIVPTSLFTPKDKDKIAFHCKEFLGKGVDFQIRIADKTEFAGSKQPLLIRREP